MATPKIRKAPSICDGAACIGRTQIPVWELVVLRAQGCSDQNLLSDYPQLGRDDLKAAFSYYAQNIEEIDDAITVSQASAAQNPEN
jgi:uncharacterized protein (DUF433 family)